MGTTPRYLKIRNDLLGKVRSGEYPEGQLIPSETALAEQYGVSRPTIRQALQVLVDDGYLERRRRRGTVVCRSKIQNDFTLRVESFDAQMSARGRSTSTAVLLCKVVEAEEEVSERLGIKLAAPVGKLVRMRYVEGEPQVYVTTYVPLDAFSDFAEQDFTVQRLYDYLASRGRPVAIARRTIDVTKADDALADLLDVAAGDPLFLFHTVGRDACGRAIEYSIARYRGESNTFEVEVRA